MKLMSRTEMLRRLKKETPLKITLDKYNRLVEWAEKGGRIPNPIYWDSMTCALCEVLTDSENCPLKKNCYENGCHIYWQKMSVEGSFYSGSFKTWLKYAKKLRDRIKTLREREL